MKWKNLKQKLLRFHQRALWVPFDDAPLDVWARFAKSAPRWLVEETAEKWIKEFFATAHWDAVYSLLKRRCDSFEYPVLSQAFIETNRERICIVANGSSAIHVVACAECSEKEYPFYVVEQNGKFRGIAVTYGLIVVGVLNKLCLKEKEQKLQEVNKTRPLSVKDFGFLFRSQKEVSQMLQDIGLEPLHGRYWMPACVWDCQSGQSFLTPDEAFVIAKI